MALNIYNSGVQQAASLPFTNGLPPVGAEC